MYMNVCTEQLLRSVHVRAGREGPTDDSRLQMSMFYYAPRMQVENACQLDTSDYHLQLSLHHEFVLFVSHTWAIAPATCIACSISTGVGRGARCQNPLQLTTAVLTTRLTAA